MTLPADTLAALKAKEAELRAKQDADLRQKAANAAAALDGAMRANIGGAYLTGIDGATLRNDGHIWEVVKHYMAGALAVRAKRGGAKTDITADFTLRDDANPLQPYLDRLQRRTR